MGVVIRDRCLTPLTLRTLDVPSVPEERRVEVEGLGSGFHKVAVSYGFVDVPDISRALELRRVRELRADPTRTSYLIGRETLIPTPRPPLGPVEGRVFAFLSADNLSPTTYFGIPLGQVVELGAQVEL